MQKLFLIFIPLALSFFAAVLSSAAALESDADFQASQKLRAEAVTLFRGGDAAAAMLKMEEALSLRPDNPALLFNLMFLAVQAEDAERATQYANRYAAMGLVPNAQVSEGLKGLLDADNWTAIEAAFNHNGKRLGSGKLIHSVPVGHALVEGVAIDESSNWFFSTVADGKIIKATSDGHHQVLLEGQKHGFGSFFGIRYHNRQKALYATYGHVEQSAALPGEGMPKTGLLKLDPETGEELGHWPLPLAETGQQIADIAIGNSGDVFVTDAQANTIFRLTASGLEEVPLSAEFMNLQGLVVLDERHLLVADYGRGLWKVDLLNSTARLLDVPAAQTLIGIDGLVKHDGRIFAIQNGVTPHRIVEVKLDEGGQTIEAVRIMARALPEFDEPTLGVSTPGGLVVVAASQWPKYYKGGVVREGMQAKPTAILSISTDH